MSVLPEDEKRKFEGLLTLHLGDATPIAGVAVFIGQIAARDAPAGNSARIAQWLLHRALSESTPDLFLRLVQEVDRAGEVEAFHELATDLLTGSTAWRTGSASVLWLPRRRPFLDRDALRDHLTLMARGLGPPAITIEGGTGQGKRTMTRFIDDLAAVTESFIPLSFELRPDPEEFWLPTLIGQLREESGLPPPPDYWSPEAQREASTSAATLVQEMMLNPSGAVIWLVVNVVQAAGLEPEVLRFISDLVEQVQSAPELTRRLRVIVLTAKLVELQFRADFPADCRHVLPAMTSAQIRSWFAEVLPSIDSMRCAIAADSVIRRLDAECPPEPKRLSRLGSLCLRTYQTLSRGASP